MSTRLNGKTLTADLSYVSDPDAKKRMNDFLEAANTEAIPLQELERRAKSLKPEDLDYINQHSNLIEIVKHLRGSAMDKLSELVAKMFMGGGSGRSIKVPIMEIPTEFLDGQKELLRTWTAKFAATGHFANSAAAADFADQLIGFMDTPGIQDPPEPRKMPVLQ